MGQREWLGEAMSKPHTPESLGLWQCGKCGDYNVPQVRVCHCGQARASNPAIRSCVRNELTPNTEAVKHPKQKRRGVPNKTEMQWYKAVGDYSQDLADRFRFEATTFRNLVTRYTPDFAANDAMLCVEVKGAFARTKDINRLKEAAAYRPAWTFLLFQKRKDGWYFQRIPSDGSALTGMQRIAPESIGKEVERMMRND
jgi:hypothetical protein